MPKAHRQLDLRCALLMDIILKLTPAVVYFFPFRYVVLWIFYSSFCFT
jgi:hypothetical protein